MNDPDDDAPAVEPTLEARRATMAEFADAVAAYDRGPSGERDRADRTAWEAGQAEKHQVLEATLPPYILRAINQGRPHRLAKPRRGKWPDLTQFDLFHQHRRRHHQRLVKLPALRRGKGYVDAEHIREIARQLAPTTPRHKLVRAISQYLARARLHLLDDSTIRKALKK